MRVTLISTTIFVFALAIGYVGYRTYVYEYAYAQQATLLGRLQFSLLNAPQWRYGTILSIDRSSGALGLRLANGSSIRATLIPNAYVARQDMVSENGVYTSALTPVPIIIDDLQVGQRFAASIVRSTQGEFVLPVLLVGDPL